MSAAPDDELFAFTEVFAGDAPMGQIVDCRSDGCQHRRTVAGQCIDVGQGGRMRDDFVTWRLRGSSHADVRAAA
jgi:hypothetical protein